MSTPTAEVWLVRRSPYELAVTAVTQPQQAQAGHPAGRDPALAGRRRDGGGADAEPFPFAGRGDLLQVSSRSAGVASLSSSCTMRIARRSSSAGRDGVGRLVFRALGHDVVAAVRARPHGPAQIHRSAGEAGQLEHDVLGHVTEVGATRHRRQEPARLPAAQ